MPPPLLLLHDATLADYAAPAAAMPVYVISPARYCSSFSFFAMLDASLPFGRCFFHTSGATSYLFHVTLFIAIIADAAYAAIARHMRRYAAAAMLAAAFAFLYR